MPHTLSVTVRVDLDLREVTLAVFGCLTAETHVSLLSIIAKARGLEPAPSITVDLLGTEHIDLDGLLPLRQLIDLEPDSEFAPVTYRIPDPLPICPRRTPSAPTDWVGAASPTPGAVGGAPLALLRGAEQQSAGTTAVEAPPAPAPVTPSSRPRTRSRREEILEGSAQMFAEHGYYGASLRDISRHVGISHPGLMHHFASKDALLEAVVDLLEAHAQNALDQVEAMSTAPEVMLRALPVHWHPSALPVQLLTTLGAEAVRGDHPGRFRMSRLRRVHEHIFEQCFAGFARQGLLRRGLDPAFASRALFGLVLNLAVRERTVRTMQNGCYDDAPIEELSRLSRAFLRTDSER
ncbi:TetR family transcriptional regulator [Brachybacterium vulturis]|uniref:TetR family transcriptional regulator n=1 Tax=Brachybacterium vulturis TaxID=2017484 RepID=A0A291GN42_9MICO|nr:TetR/AcrR family transcriptional regulator [Brachybacterium vulturis]ATG51645.1 TetR family transcriptional regulator [Brachybacterium vulturis]